MDEWELRKIFNAEQFEERVATGEIELVVIHRGIPAADKGEPLGTESQAVSFREKDGNELARGHRYLRPDGTLGASGKIDPKRVLKDGYLYRLAKKR